MSAYLITDAGRVDVRLKHFEGQPRIDWSDDPVAERVLTTLKRAGRALRRNWLVEMLPDPPTQIDAALRRLAEDGEVAHLGQGAWAAHGALAPDVWPLPRCDPYGETAERLVAAIAGGASMAELSEICGPHPERWIKSLRAAGRIGDPRGVAETVSEPAPDAPRERHPAAVEHRQADSGGGREAVTDVMPAPDDPVAERVLTTLKRADRALRRNWLVEMLPDPPGQIDSALRRLAQDGEVASLGRGAWTAHGARPPDVWPLPRHDPYGETADRLVAEIAGGASMAELAEICGPHPESWIKSLRAAGRIGDQPGVPQKESEPVPPARHPTAAEYRQAHGGLGSEAAAKVLRAQGEMTRAACVDALLARHPGRTRAEALLAIGCAEDEGAIVEARTIGPEGVRRVLRPAGPAARKLRVKEAVGRMLGGIAAAGVVSRAEIDWRLPADARAKEVIEALLADGLLANREGGIRVTRPGARAALAPDPDEIAGLTAAQTGMLRLVRALEPLAAPQLQALALLAGGNGREALAGLLRRGLIACWASGYGLPACLHAVDLGRPGPHETAWRGAFGPRGLAYAVTLLQRIRGPFSQDRFRDLMRGMGNVRKAWRVLGHLGTLEVVELRTDPETGLHARFSPDVRLTCLEVCESHGPVGTLGRTGTTLGLDEMVVLALAGCLSDPAVDDLQQGVWLLGFSGDANQAARRLEAAGLGAQGRGRLVPTDAGERLAGAMTEALGRRGIERTRAQIEEATV